MEDLLLKYQEEYQHFNDLTINRKYDILFKEYEELLKSILLVDKLENLEDIQEYIEDVVPFDMETIILYLSALNGDTLMIGCFEGDITNKLWEYIGSGILDYDLEFIINDEEFFEDEYYIEDYIHSWNEVLKPLGKELYCRFNNEFCEGVYFIYLEIL